MVIRRPGGGAQECHRVVDLQIVSAVAGTLYGYSVKAVAGSAESAASAPDNGWRNVPAPLSIAASDGTSSAHVAVTWAAVSGANGYRVFRTSGASTLQLGNPVSAGTLSYNDTGAAVGTVYTYTVKAVTAAGDSAASAGNTGWRNIAPPATVTASDGASTAHVAVTWTAVTGATGYKLFRTLGSTTSQVGSTFAATALAANDTGAAVGTVYTYTVKAVTAAGDSAASAGNTGWRNIAPPATVSASDGTNINHVTVTWSGAVGATGYKLFRTLGTATTQVGSTLPSGTLTFNDTGAARGTRYTYAVKAVTAAGDSAASAGNTGWRNITVVASDGTSTAHVALAWSTVTGATSYKVFRSNGTATPATLIATVTSPSRNDTTAVAGVTYNYAVKAVVGGVDQPLSGANTGFRAPAAGMPTGGSAEVRGLGAVSAAMPAHSTGAPLGRPEIGSATDTGEGRAATGARAAKAEAIRGPDAVGERVEFLVEGAERPPVSGHRCDINEDGAVDGDDLDAWLAALHAGDPASCDLDGDGDVGPGDLELLLRALSPSEHAQRPVR